MTDQVDGFPLAPQQKQLLLLEQFDKSPAYRAMIAVALEGAVDEGKLRSAANAVVARHEALRTTFKRPTGMRLPLMVIEENLGPAFEVAKLTSDEAIAGAMFEAYQAPFDYEKGPAVRFSLFSSPGRTTLAISAPQAIADAKSLRNIVTELAAIYGGAGELDEPLQYADFAAWQTEQLESTDADATRAKEHWKKLEPGVLPAMPLPNEKRPETHATFLPLQLPVELDAATLDKLVEVGARFDAPPSATILAAWQALLWRLVTQAEIVVGVASEARTNDEMTSAVGAFAKTLPVVAQLEGSVSFAELVRETRRLLAEAERHQDYLPFDENAASGGHTTFAVGFELADRAKHSAGGVTFSTVEEIASTGRFALKLVVARGEGGSSVRLAFDPSLFDLDDVKRFGGYLATLTKSIIAAPETALSTLAILTDAEKRHLLVDLNATSAAYRVDRTIHAMIEEQATARPDKTAVRSGDRALSFAELDRKANQLARHLVGLNVGVGSMVGICVGRSIDMVVGILGILKTGATYVPLDPDYPKDRRAYQLKDAAVPVLLTEQALLADMPENSAKVVLLDGDAATIGAQSGDRLEPRGTVNDVAYLIYTSGTTGNPRGVQITHGNLCHYVQAMQPGLGITHDDTYLHTASVAFSSSVRQLVFPLAHGATVVIASTDERRDPKALFATIKRDGVTTIDLVPSHWRACSEVLDRLPVAERTALLDNKLRLIVSASEALWSDVPSHWRKGLGHGAKLINMFGQTETTGIVSTYPIPEETGGRVHIVPLGKPIANSQIYVLDQHLQPVPFGVVGELIVGGLGVGKGYLNQPERTAEKLIKNPFSDDPASKLYRSGDRARFLRGGNVEFLGRSDNQVKIRGFRIELGEIEVTLGAHPTVREAVVIAREDEPGDKRLVAYVTPHGARKDVHVADLRTHATAKLPSYMVPSAIVVLDELPMTPNGKVDRKNLPAPTANADRVYTAPRTDLEEALAGLWAEVLNAKEVGIHDNFFEVGGHSLLATQLISRVRDTFKVDLAVRSLFEATTVAEQAEVLVKAEIKPGLVDKIAKVLLKVQRMSADEAKQALASKK